MLVSDTVEDDFEIVIGLVAPIGTNLKNLSNAIRNALPIYGYTSSVIRLSDLLKTVELVIGPATKDAEDQQSSSFLNKMNLGDLARERFGSGDAVAAFGIAQIGKIRYEQIESMSQNRRHAWIIWSLKHEDEVTLMRSVYGDRFVLVGANEEEDSRKNAIRRELERKDPKGKGHDAATLEIISRDHKDEAHKLGQRVREVFSLADFFVTMSGDVERSVGRFLSVIFGEPFQTPTKDEMAMYHAYAQSLRSSDAGRQVGAVITDGDGNIISVGCNDVPKAGGGIPWAEDPHDYRDFRRGVDYNNAMMLQSLTELLDALAEIGALSEALEALPGETRAMEVRNDQKSRIDKTRLMSLIEFGRISHAEMTAITQTARSSISAQGGTIYTTAFPCHMCMRLIIATGIKRVVYIDPYPKSLAWDMYSEALSEDETGCNGRVEVAPFYGTAPNIFAQSFIARGRIRSDEAEYEAPNPTKLRFKKAGPDPLLASEQKESQVIVALEVAIKGLSEGGTQE